MLLLIMNIYTCKDSFDRDQVLKKLPPTPSCLKNQEFCLLFIFIFSTPNNINFETLRLTDFRSGDDDGARLGDMLRRYGHFLFSYCKLSWKTSDQYVSAMKGLIIGHFPTLTLLLNGFYKTDGRADETDINKHH
jgi:hypothetical protein